MLDRAVGQERAVKIVQPDRVHDQTNFYGEPQILIQLRHEHIVAVHDAGRMTNGALYISMEYLPDGSVEDRYRGGVAPVAAALQVISEACRGLEFAHAQGFIHRDIKPANLLLGGGIARVSDFGLATRVDAQGVASPVGYVAHLASEVIASDETSVASDVYALGVTLYRLLNGDSFLQTSADLPNGLEAAILNGDYPDRTRFREYIHDPLRRVVRKALTVDPDRRTPSAAALRHDLERVWPRVSWFELASTSLRRWHGESSRHTFLAEAVKVGAAYTFTIKRRPLAGSAWRRLTGDHASVGSERDVLRHAAAVLQRLATHGA